MIPASPDPAETAPVAAEPRSPFWDYVDLWLLMALLLFSLFVAAGFVRLASHLLHLRAPLQALLFQSIVYVFLFGALWALLRVRYGRPFWRSLGWKVNAPGVALSPAGGPLLALGMGFLGYLLRTPQTSDPFQQMLEDRTTLIAFAVFGVVIGPLSEELAFRGFLMPLLVRSTGAAPGILTTGLLFGLLHAPQYGWHWQHVVLIGIVGSVFGWVRYKSGSLVPAVLMHASYNLTQLGFFLLQQRTI